MSHLSLKCLLVFATLVVGGARAGGAVPVYGGPASDATYNGGHSNGVSSMTGIGAAVGLSDRRIAGGALSTRAVRWDSLGNFVELTTGVAPSGSAGSIVNAINSSGTAVGYSTYPGAQRVRAARWDASGGLTVLDSPFDTSLDIGNAKAVSDDGTVVGSVEKYNGSGSSLGDFAVRWNAGTTTPLPLGVPSGGFGSYALAINHSGATAVGFYTQSQGGMDGLPVRWNASGDPTALGSINPPGAIGYGTVVHAVNDAGTAVGTSLKKNSSISRDVGYRAVRWDSSGTAATELQGLGVATDGSSFGSAVAINNAGTAVGIARKYDSFGASLGDRAVRWEAGSTAAVELGLPTGYISSGASAINSMGIVAGNSTNDGNVPGFPISAATIWFPDGTPLNLNTLIDPSSGWNLETCVGISDDGWVSGNGFFKPPGEGSYARGFLIHVPEPSIALKVLCVVVGLVGRHKTDASRRSVRRPR